MLSAFSLVPSCARPRCVTRLSSMRVQAVADKPNPVTDNASVKKPDWLPEQLSDVVDFLNATDFDVKQSNVYKQKLAKFVEDPVYQQLVGWNEVPEAINGRLAMLGFVGAAFAEICGAGSIASQLAAGQQAVFAVTIAVVVASCVPFVKGTSGNYMESLRETYTLPEGVFTQPLERVHGRLAMLGLASLVLIELVKGSSLF